MDQLNVENRTLKHYIHVNLKLIAFERDWTSTHLRDNKDKLDRFSNYNGIGELDIQSIASRHITDFLMHLSKEGNYRMKKGLDNKTINRYCAALSVLFKYAKKQKDIAEVPDITWRDEGKGSFLTNAHAIRLLVHPVFSGTSKESALNSSLSIDKLSPLKES